MKNKLETHPANPLLGMMSSYHSDNEDEHQDDSEEKVVEENESSHVTVETTGSKQSQLDKQVADFLRVRVSAETAVFIIGSVCVTNDKRTRTNSSTLMELALLIAVLVGRL